MLSLQLQVNATDARASPRSRQQRHRFAFLHNNHINSRKIATNTPPSGRTEGYALNLHLVRNSREKVRLVREGAYCPRSELCGDA